MKGIIFNVVEEAIVAEHGEAVWDDLLDRADLDGAFTSIGNYPDASLFALVGAGAQALDVPPADLTRHLGHASLLGLAERYPHYFAPHTDAEVLVVNYRSQRGLCALAEGMIVGTGTHYGETVTVHQSACLHDGHDHCVLHVTFPSG